MDFDVIVLGAGIVGVWSARHLQRAENAARPIFGFGRRLDDGSWLGLRPCTPDMRPVIGDAPCHHGLTLGPVTGCLRAEIMSGSMPVVDPYPFRPGRFR
ncbi:hypothetical protein R69776_07801 [Paraburkholderia nemoris]|uniref:FAD-dependent oxidoreductase n=1 Tax=Paraburkholderia nemoris TaxID=2793076 RepID=A0ABM8T4D4_9BURK|nr:hypothetical protein R69776_07801 [Paraburkholderia nemoris]